VWSNDPESYSGCRVATGRDPHAGQVEGDDRDKKRYPGPQGWGLGVGLTTSPCKTWICLETSTDKEESRVEEECCPKTGRSVTEEEESTACFGQLHVH
jgi:hypothetical protein